MLKNKALNGLATISFGLVLTAVTGCQQQQKPENINNGMVFRPDNESRATQTLMQTQIHAGARTDATLYPEHFDGAALNSLGMAKLDAMLHDSRSTNPITIYIAVTDDSLTQDRHVSIGNYLIDHGGLRTEQITFASGPNPNTYAPADPNLKNYDRTDTSLTAGSGGDSSSSSGGGAAGH